MSAATSSNAETSVARLLLSLSVHGRRGQLFSNGVKLSDLSDKLVVLRSDLAQNLFSNNSRVLVVSAGAGHSVMALNKIGVNDVNGVELVESHPLVGRADPHSLPFFDDVFDFGFSPFLERALFPARYVGEMERTVKGGGACVVAVEECGGEEVEEVEKLFRKSKLVEVNNVTLGGEKRTSIVMKVVK
uniref:Methyltransferase type 11 domain-containing protein n=1 Tax=Nicotiana tabacum TaxID=4097 RepID=A0A1S4B0R1_TOBAC|nr:PREDICTED: uncharacterized protein LOC107803262 [Nicotiana tabacum]